MNPQQNQIISEKVKNRKALAIALENVWQVLGNRNRIEILFNLCDSEQTWSELMFSLQMNPRTLSLHLKYLQEYDIVSKHDDKYKLTSMGEKICELNFIKPEVLGELSERIKIE